MAAGVTVFMNEFARKCLKPDIRQPSPSRYNTGMSTIIAIDTSSDIASVALMCGETIHSTSSEGFSNHSLTVLPMLQKLLEKHDLTVAGCDAIAFGCGPGSFTGLRTACGIAQGLSFATSLPVIPVVTLEAMAQTCYEQTGAIDVLALLDARMHEVYWAQYRYENGQWKTVSEPCLTAASSVVPEGKPVFCGNGLSAYAGELVSIVGKSLKWPDIHPDARAIARLGKIRLEREETVTAKEIQPLYLRNKVALKTAERLALKGKTA